jgi:hypothetical protein
MHRMNTGQRVLFVATVFVVLSASGAGSAPCNDAEVVVSDFLTIRPFLQPRLVAISDSTPSPCSDQSIGITGVFYQLLGTARQIGADTATAVAEIEGLKVIGIDTIILDSGYPAGMFWVFRWTRNPFRPSPRPSPA